MSSYYHRHADELADRYERAPTEEVHGAWLSLIPKTKGLVLDVGAGSGRDAAWMAEQGHEVVAVEPAEAMRTVARERHPQPNIQWIDDRLPSLEKVHQLDYQFDVVLLSAVWMHLPLSQRERAFRKLAQLLRPGGLLVITLRKGPNPEGRRFHPVTAEEVTGLARNHALEVVLEDAASGDALGRKEVSWETLALRAPDDGTGALPLLRHVVVNDNVSSTYKMALLRSLLRIADGARGVVLAKDERQVQIPIGLVALYWVRQFRRLVLDNDFLQRPKVNQLGFAKDAFLKIDRFSPHDLRVGARFVGSDARCVVQALKDARDTIRKMPARYITYPGTDDPLFQGDAVPTRVKGIDSVTLDLDFLAGMGTLTMPRTVWEAMSRYACWIEPAIVDRWCDLMQGYDADQGRKQPLGHYRAALTWLDAEHDTAEVRSIAEEVRRRSALYCVWTGKKLRGAVEIDHCFPFAYWPNNDLWNLLPARPSVNRRKRDRLPSAEALAGARERILDWWDRAYRREKYSERFAQEAAISLPGVRHLESEVSELDRVALGVQRQRIRLKRDQQIAEWAA